MNPRESCLICSEDPVKESDVFHDPYSFSYICDRCGHLYLTEEAAVKIYKLEPADKIKLGIGLRNKFENRDRIKYTKPFNAMEIELLVNRSGTLDPMTKIDQTLINLHKKTEYVGQVITIDKGKDYFYYHCRNPSEVAPLLDVLVGEGYIHVLSTQFPEEGLLLNAKGYRRLSEIEKVGVTNNCFVAMWFDPEMDKIYDQAIKPAIEFVEDGGTEPKYRAILIKNEEHINDINDEIIAQIRRSRFMVCDLTGYRGGVYFEAGFGYGLGVDVIYTCREDWSKKEKFKDAEGKPVEKLYDSKGVPIRIRKEGVHFDLE